MKELDEISIIRRVKYIWTLGTTMVVMLMALMTIGLFVSPAPSDQTASPDQVSSMFNLLDSLVSKGATIGALFGILLIGMTLIGFLTFVMSLYTTLLFNEKQPRKLQVAKPPGSRSMSFIRLLYSAKSIEKIFDPIYADFCEEYFAALSAGKKWHAHWIRVRYYKDFVKAVGLFGVVRLAKTVFEYWEKIA